MSDMDHEYKMIRANYVESAYHPTSDQDITNGEEEFDEFMNKRLADAWCEGEKAGRWNTTKHVGGPRVNPHQKE